LDSNDFEIEDYVKGYVKKKSDGRTMKIGNEEQIAHGMVDKEYGSVSKKFKSVVEQFVEYLNKGEGGGLYYRHGAVYGEGKRKILLINKNTPDRILIKNLEQDIISLKDIIDKGIEPSEQVQLLSIE